MANKIVVKRSSVQGNVPTTAQLDLGEFAINTYDGKVFIKKNDGADAIVEVGTDTLASVTGRGATTATAISLTNTTGSTSTATGALTVAGGVGVGGQVSANYLWGKFQVYGGSTAGNNFSLNDGGNMYLRKDATQTLGSGADATGFTYIYSSTDAGASVPLKIFSNGNIGSTADLTFTSTNAHFGNTTASTSTTTGALTVAGGVGVGGDVYSNLFVVEADTGEEPLLAMNNPAWGTPYHEVMGFDFATGTKDALILKVPGNSVGAHGTMYLGDEHVYFGVSTSSLANVDNASATAPFATETWGYLGKTGLTVNGQITSTGEITAFSDAKFKTNVETIGNALSKVCDMRGVYYNRIDVDPELRRVGVIAQEVEKVLPEVVVGSVDKSVNYGAIVGLLIESIKELKAEVEELKARL